MAIRRISPAEAKQRLGEAAALALFDIRERGEYNTGHIPGSTSLPRRDIEFRLARLLPAPSVPVIVTGDVGARDVRAATALDRAGCNDVAILEGGLAAWTQAGYPIASGVNVPSKAFGEKVHAERRVPETTPQELAESIRGGAKPLVLDVRTPEEYARFCIPGAVNVPGGDLILWAEELKNSRAPVVVNCAGRTRSIVGTEALRRLGVKDVRALRNGTMGWVLADYDLERPQRSPAAPSASSRAAAERIASRIAEEEKIAFISVAQLGEVLIADKTTTVYPIDVRSLGEYLSGHIPGFFNVPGGQSVQCADDHIAVRNAKIIFACDRTARAVMAAYWYGKMGFRNVFVLQDGSEGWARSGRSLEIGAPSERVFGLDEARARAAFISSSALASSIDRGEDPLVMDVGLSTEYASGHVPGAVWLSRGWLEEILPKHYPDLRLPIIATAADERQSILAAAALSEMGYESVRALAGGTRDWIDGAKPIETGLTKTLAEANDVVLSASVTGDKDAMRRYLDWEVKLTGKAER
ncbi:MAG TPA: rhodanese-like domain-containing protein [Candidatus Binatia bacterium]|jgi:rhodanese-related sulfurtransferase